MESAHAPLSARQAAQAIQDLDEVHGALARRTAGVTWMIWGLATPAIFLSYSLAGAFGVYDGGTPPIWSQLLWAPWVAIGVLTTIALWRSAGLVLPIDPEVSRRHGIFTMVVFLGVMAAAFTVMAWAQVAIAETAVALLALALANIAMGAFGFQCSDRTDRMAWLGVGSAILAVAVVGSVAFSALSRDDLHAAWALLAPAATSVIYVGTGLLLANRG